MNNMFSTVNTEDMTTQTVKNREIGRWGGYLNQKNFDIKFVELRGIDTFVP